MEHQKYVQQNFVRFTHWAGKIGRNTQVVLHAILSSYKVERQGYKSCLELLKLVDKYEYTPEPFLMNIRAILASGQDNVVPDQTTATVSSFQFCFTLGAEYYGRRNE